MHDLDAILFNHDLSPDEREAFRRVLADDAELRDGLVRWTEMLQGVTDSVEALVPDRRLLVLEGIRRAGGGAMLLPGDLQYVRENESILARALGAHPGLNDVVAHVEEDVAVFEQAWSAEANAFPESARTVAAVRRDRGALPRGRASAARWGWRVTASAAVIAFAFVVNFLIQRESGLESVTTGPDQTHEVVLADGSSVRLLPNSTLEYRADPGRSDRYVRLRGDGYFDVVPDRSGFTIETPTAIAVVLGTSFGVQSDEHAARIYLDTGRLSVASSRARTAPVMLQPGQMTTVARDSLPEPPVETDVTRALSWTGLLIFRDTPLYDVTSVLTETYGTTVTADARLREETLTATFERTDGLATVLEAVAAALDASVVMENDVRLLVPR